MTKLRAALAQINTTVGDLRGNTAKIIEYIDRARAEGADLVSFPELTITGYPPEDLLYKHNLIRDNRECLDEVIEHSAGIAVVVGFVDWDEGLFNAAAVIQDRGFSASTIRSICPTTAFSTRSAISSRAANARFSISTGRASG